MQQCKPWQKGLIAKSIKSSILQSPSRHYRHAQRKAWANAIHSQQLHSLSNKLFCQPFLREMGGIIGLKTNGDGVHIELLFVNANLQGKGFSEKLYDAVVLEAHASRALKITVNASDTAASFFRRKGFVEQQGLQSYRQRQLLTSRRLVKLI